ncbi:hypothetical protein ACEWY4_000133 [Coilia grayii]|uniref:B3/B4 tRNA-binding domain-containing protein n=1 Tax=Coilia grayii TaxID=363190 RepID=A0ABD1KVS5_9TELE
MDGKDDSVWTEIEKAEKENRRELVLQGTNTDKRIESNGGLSSKLYSLTLLNYLEISQCPSLTEVSENIGNLIHLQSLILCRNKIASVPKSIGKLKSLKVLDVSVNELQNIPEEVSLLSELNTLNVSCNSITSLPKGLSQCTKLSTINVSKNGLTTLPDDLFSERLDLLSTIVASENALEELSANISNLPALKTLDLSSNKLSELPFELGDCAKLKEINFKGNKLKDKRLEKMVNGCQTKSVLDYLRAGGRGRGKGKAGGEAGEKGDAAVGGGARNTPKKKGGGKQKRQQQEEEDELEKMVLRVLHVSDNPTVVTVKVATEVKEVRPYIVCCVVRGMNLKSGNALKRFLMAQTKLHDDLCAKRTTATIATHDVQLLKSPLLYDARTPNTLKIVPLGRKEMNAVDLLKHLQQEADEQRKQKKRQNVSGLHKYLQLLDGKSHYPCLVDTEGHVISFPPITNSEKTKIKKSTKELFLEVTSSNSLQTCKDVMDALITKMAELNKSTFDHKEADGSDEEGEPEPTPAEGDGPAGPELTVQQVRITDMDGNLKVVYPSKTDLTAESGNLRVIR